MGLKPIEPRPDVPGDEERFNKDIKAMKKEPFRWNLPTDVLILKEKNESTKVLEVKETIETPKLKRTIAKNTNSNKSSSGGVVSK